MIPLTINDVTVGDKFFNYNDRLCTITTAEKSGLITFETRSGFKAVIPFNNLHNRLVNGGYKRYKRVGIPPYYSIF